MRSSNRQGIHRSLLAVATAALLLAGLTACGSDDKAPTSAGDGTTTTVDSAGGNYDAGGGGGTSSAAGTIVAKDFSLTDLTVAPGAEIVLQNDGSTKHTATADDGTFELQADGGSTSSATTAPSEPGSYPFHCEIHASMTATLTVEA